MPPTRRPPTPRLPLRWTLPCALFLALLVAGSLSYLALAGRAQLALTEDYRAHLRELAALEARNLAVLLSREVTGDAAALLQEVRIERPIGSAMLLDAGGQVLAASEPTVPGQTFSLGDFEPAQAGVALRQTGTQLWAVASVAPTNAQAAAPYRLVLAADLDSRLTAALTQVRVTVFWNLLYFALLSLLLGLFVHVALVRRLSQLGNAFSRALGGEAGVSLKPGPADELGLLTHQFNAATALLDETRASNDRLMAALTQLAQPDPAIPVFDAIARAVAVGLDCVAGAVVQRQPEGDGLALLGQWGLPAPIATADLPAAGSCYAWLAELEGEAFCAREAARGAGLDDPLLAAVNAQCFGGIALRDEQGQPLGALLALSRLPVPDGADARALLRVAARRASQELQRKTAEQALKSQRAQLELAMQAGELAIWTWQAGTGFQVGADWCVLFSDAAAGGQTFSHETRAHPDDLARVVARFESHLAGHTDSHQCEYRLRDGSGQWRRIIEQGRVISRDAAGRPTRALGIHKDITRVAQLEADLVARTEFLELATRGSMDGLWDWDIPNHRCYTSPRLAELLGYPPGQLPTTPEDLIAHLHDPQAVASEDELLALNAPDAQYLKRDFRLRLYDGTWRWFNVRAALVRDAAGQLLRMVGSMTDIEAQRQREAELAQARQLLQESIESLDSGLLRLDAEDRVVFCNSRYREMYEHPPEQVLVGMRFRDVVRWGFEQHLGELRGRTVDEAVEQRMALHRHEAATREIHLQSAGRWVLASDRPTKDGGVVSLRTEITAQKLMEAALTDRTELLELAMQGSEAGLWDWQADGPSFRLSARCCELLGDSAQRFDDSLPGFIDRRCHPEERPALLRWLRRITVDPRQGEVFGRELRLLCRDLTWRWFNARAAVIRGPDGRVLRVAGSLVDIDARKAHDAELAAARQHLSDAVESLDAGLVMYDAAGRLVFCNRRFQDLFAPAGLTLLPGQRVETLLRQHYAALPATAGEGTADEFLSRWQARLRTRLGTRELQVGERWFQIDDLPTHGGGIVSLRTETTAVRRAEQALRESEARLRTVFEGSPVGIFLADTEGNLSYANTALAELLALAGLPQPRQQWLHAFHPDERASVGARLQRFLAAPEGSLRFEARLATPQAEPRQVYLQVRPVLEAGRLLGFAGTLEDISERRRQELAQRQLQGQLQQAQKMEAIGQLTGGVAHDFNNILAGVLGYATLATLRPAVAADPKLQEYLSAVVTAGERARDLVAKMLAFSRSRPAEPQTLVPLPTLPLLNEVVSLLRSLIPASHQLVTDFAPGLPPLQIDGVDLHQAVINLAINARDAIEGHGKITISAREPRAFSGTCASCRAPIAGEFVEIAVRDSGSGMAAELLPRIFDPFFSTKEVGKGTGMGLAVTHGVVHAAGGHLLVESTPGAGTAVRLLLPAAAATAAPLPPTPLPPMRSSLPQTLRTVLVVDDEPTVGEMWREVLTGQGLRVEVFTEPAAALAWVLGPQGHCDLLMTDQTMPGMTGLELARAFLARRPGVPVVLSTGLEGGVDAQLASAVGVGAIHVKPVPIERMLDSIRAGLAGTLGSSQADWRR